jgi:hypothetical protein
MTERVSISEDMAAKVLFAADRTCCICRVEKKVQIHHIDGDPSNNDFNNLAVICLHCHSEAHSTGGFVRRLTPDLVRLYNNSWRAIVKLKLNPMQDPTGRREYASEVFLEASLDCHSWKVFYMALYSVKTPPGRNFIDIWDLLIEITDHNYSPKLYQYFEPLFNIGLEDVKRRFDRLVQLYPDILPYDFRTVLLRAYRQLDTERRGYSYLPKILDNLTQKQQDGFFNVRFRSVLKILRDVDRDADTRRKAIITEDSTT